MSDKNRLLSDDRDLKEKLKEAVLDSVRESDTGEAWVTDNGLGKILTLLQPKIANIRAETRKEIGEEILATVEHSADYREMENNLKFMAKAWLGGIKPSEALKKGERPE